MDEWIMFVSFIQLWAYKAKSRMLHVLNIFKLQKSNQVLYLQVHNQYESQEEHVLCNSGEIWTSMK